jgi:hypothetical protein
MVAPSGFATGIATSNVNQAPSNATTTPISTAAINARVPALR